MRHVCESESKKKKKRLGERNKETLVQDKDVTAGLQSRLIFCHWERNIVRRCYGNYLNRIKTVRGILLQLQLQAYLSFLNNGLKIFHEVVLLLEADGRTVCELYEIMSILRTKLQQREVDGFFGVWVLSSNSSQTKREQQSNRIFPISMSLHSANLKSGMTSPTTATTSTLQSWG